MKKGRSRVEIASPIHIILLKTSDERMLIIDQEGNTRVADDGRALLRIIKDIFEIDAYIS